MLNDDEPTGSIFYHWLNPPNLRAQPWTGVCITGLVPQVRLLLTLGRFQGKTGTGACSLPALLALWGLWREG